VNHSDGHLTNNDANMFHRRSTLSVREVLKRYEMCYEVTSSLNGHIICDSHKLRGLCIYFN
jgi:hypothetical protein